MALPKRSIEQLLREVVGDETPISKQTIDWINECAVDLLQLVGKEANVVAENAAKKENYRITCEHTLVALENLGMQRYADAIRAEQGSLDLEMQKKKERIASTKSAASHEDMLAEQTALFKQASVQAKKEGW